VDFPKLAGGDEIVQERALAGQGKERRGQGRARRGDQQAKKKDAAAGEPRPHSKKPQRLRDRNHSDQAEEKTQIHEDDGHGVQVRRLSLTGRVSRSSDLRP